MFSPASNVFVKLYGYNCPVANKVPFIGEVQFVLRERGNPISIESPLLYCLSLVLLVNTSGSFFD